MSQFSNKPSGTQTAATSAAAGAAAGSGTIVIIGAVLAVLAVVLMNVYVEMRVAAADEEEITLFQYVNALDPGDIVDERDVVPIRVAKQYEDAFGLGAVRETAAGSGMPSATLGQRLTVAVTPEQVVQTSHFLASGRSIKREASDRGLDEITLNIDSKEQPPNLRPGDYVDLYASVPKSRRTEFMRVMEYVKVVSLGERVADSGAEQSGRSNKYGTITIYVDPDLSSKLFDIQKLVDGQSFNVTRRDPQDTRPRELNTGGSKEISQRVLDSLGLN